jgi:hypothetical protein
MERVLFSGSAKFGLGSYCRGCYYGRGCYYDLIPTTKKSYWGMSNAYYPMKLIDFCLKYNKHHNPLLLVIIVSVFQITTLDYTWTFIIQLDKRWLQTGRIYTGYQKIYNFYKTKTNKKLSNYTFCKILIQSVSKHK